MAKRGKRITNKQQKNLIALGSGVVGVGAAVLSTHGAWKVPAVGAVDTYAKMHDKVGDFIRFTTLNPGALILTAIVGLGIAFMLFRK